MITCKEDLINTYIENDYGELRDLYIEAMNIFGIRGSVNGRFDYLLEGERKYIACMTEFCRNGQSEWSSNYCDVRALKKLTLSDLKPRAKVEYDHLDRTNFNVWDLKPLFDSGELYSKTSEGEYDQYSASSPTYMLKHFMEYGVYRKVERQVEWWEDAAEYIRSLNGEANAIDFTDASSDGKKMAMNISVVLDERQAKDFARILLKQEGE